MAVLSREQRNQVFVAAQKIGLEPTDFVWSTEIQRNGEHEDKIVHSPTHSYFEFSFNIQSGYWVSCWPPIQGQRLRAVPSWEGAVRYVEAWAAQVKRDHDAPDLWAEIAKQAAIPQAASHATEGTKPFTEPELKQLEAGLDDIERFVTTTQPLDPAGQAEVKRRFEYLRSAARAGARKIDWLNIFVGQMVSMVAERIIQPAFYQPLMAHAASALNAVYQFGLKALGS